TFAGKVEEWRLTFGDVAVETWLPAMVTDLATDEKGRTALSPFAAPSGKQTLATMFGKAFQLVWSNPDLIGEALMSWRRVEGVTGEYLDHQVLQSAADRSDGEIGKEMGIPGAT